jgi:magnesium transporter
MGKDKSSQLIPRPSDPLKPMRVMGRLIRRSIKRPGSTPGTLVHTGPQKVERTGIQFIDYDSGALQETTVADVRECFALKDTETVSWINIDGLHEVEVVRALGEHFGWHPLMLEDILSVGQRPKMEEYEGYAYIVLPMMSWNPEHEHVVEEQLSIVLGSNYVVTFQELPGDDFDVVRERLRQARGRLRQRRADYLAYALMDAVVDAYFHVLEKIGDATERLEVEVQTNPREQTIHRLHAIKRELLAVRRAVWPLREMLVTITRSDVGHFSKETRLFARDVHDHAVRLVDTVEVLRDLVADAVELYLSSATFRTNEVVKLLTMMASIFIPLTFLVGVYGMNFDYMPELRVWWAYPLLMGLMLAIAVGMLIWFRRKRWL